MREPIRNAKYELLQELLFITAFIYDGEFKGRVHCATIFLNGTSYKLRTNYTQKEWDAFLHDLDQDYDARYSWDDMLTESINGTVWLEDGGWLERKDVRDEGPGVGMWLYKKAPPIPENLL